MKKKLLNHQVAFSFFSLLLALTIISCSSKDVDEPSGVDLPEWVYQPDVDDGISAAQCVPFSGNMSLDQQEITARGRASLAQQISTRAQVMDKTYQSKTEAEGKTVVGSTFESVSKQISDQELIGSKLVKTEFGEVNDQDYICGMVAITPENTDKIFNAIVDNSQTPQVSGQDKDILYQEFKAYKAQQELSEAIGK